VYAAIVERLKQVYATVRAGNPLEDGSVLIGPLIDEPAFNAMQATLSEVHALGGKVTGGDRCHAERYAAAYYVRPALIEMAEQTGPVLRETFAPLLYVMPYTDLDQAIQLHNGVPQASPRRSFQTMCARSGFSVGGGSDCGIVNVNIGPSGAGDWWCLWRRKRRAAVVKPARTPGRATCAASPAPSISAASFRSPKGFASTSARPDADAANDCTSVCDERLGDIFNDLAEHLLNSIDRPIDFRFLDNEWRCQANGVPVGFFGQDSDAQQLFNDDTCLDLLRVEFYAGEKPAAAHFAHERIFDPSKPRQQVGAERSDLLHQPFLYQGIERG
jgi:hypothetical protein